MENEWPSCFLYGPVPRVVGINFSDTKLSGGGGVSVQAFRGELGGDLSTCDFQICTLSSQK